MSQSLIHQVIYSVKDAIIQGITPRNCLNPLFIRSSIPLLNENELIIDAMNSLNPLFIRSSIPFKVHILPFVLEI